eukprot:3620435-Pyramimonas_sp.AAC.1
MASLALWPFCSPQCPVWTPSLGPPGCPSRPIFTPCGASGCPLRPSTSASARPAGTWPLLSTPGPPLWAPS